MNMIVVPTKAMFNKYIKPLLDLGFVYVLDAQKAGLITEQETKFIMAMTGGIFLNEQQFDALMHDRFSQIEANF